MTFTESSRLALVGFQHPKPDVERVRSATGIEKVVVIPPSKGMMLAAAKAILPTGKDGQSDLSKLDECCFVLTNSVDEKFVEQARALQQRGAKIVLGAASWKTENVSDASVAEWVKTGEWLDEEEQGTEDDLESLFGDLKDDLGGDPASEDEVAAVLDVEDDGVDDIIIADNSEKTTTSENNRSEPREQEIVTPEDKDWDIVLEPDVEDLKQRPKAQPIRQPKPTQVTSMADFGPSSIAAAREKGLVVFVTGTRGGVGKSTTALTMASLVGASIHRKPTRNTGEPKRPVFLVEADIKNSKLASSTQFGLERDKTYYPLAQFELELMRKPHLRNQRTPQEIDRVRNKLIKQAMHEDASGLRVFAAPFDNSEVSLDQNAIQAAVRLIVQWCVSQDGYVFIDSSNLEGGNFNPLDAWLTSVATHVVLVTDVDQGLSNRAIKLLTRRDGNGMNVPHEKIRMFLNRCSQETFESEVNSFLPIKPLGFLPSQPGLDGKWVGRTEGELRRRVLVTFAKFFNAFEPTEGLRLSPPRDTIKKNKTPWWRFRKFSRK